MVLHRHRSVPRRPGLDRSRDARGGHHVLWDRRPQALSCRRLGGRHRRASGRSRSPTALTGPPGCARSWPGTTRRTRRSASRAPATSPAPCAPRWLASATECSTCRPGAPGATDAPAGPARPTPADALAIAQVVLQRGHHSAPPSSPSWYARSRCWSSRRQAVRDRTQLIQRLRSLWLQVDPRRRGRRRRPAPQEGARRLQRDRLRPRPRRADRRSPHPQIAETSSASTSASPSSSASGRAARGARQPRRRPPRRRDDDRLGPDRPGRRRPPLPQPGRLRALLGHRSDPLRIR